MVKPYVVAVLVIEGVGKNSREVFCRKSKKSYWSKDLNHIRIFPTKRSAVTAVGQFRYMNRDSHWGKNRNLIFMAIPLSELEEWINAK